MLQSRRLQFVAGTAVFATSAFLGFKYRVASAPPPAKEVFPTEAERRRIFAANAEGWDRDVFLQELILGLGGWRKQLVQKAEGKVLEVAAGTGRNFQFYDTAKVKSLTVTDFCRQMLQAAIDKKEALGGIPSSFRLANACKLQDADEEYNSIVETFGHAIVVAALCSYEDPIKTLKELKRVLKNDGVLLLLEHGASTWPLVNMILSRGHCHHVKQFGCYSNRPILDLVEQAGFDVVSAKRKNFGTTYMIVAKKRGEMEGDKEEGERDEVAEN